MSSGLNALCFAAAALLVIVAMAIVMYFAKSAKDAYSARKVAKAWRQASAAFRMNVKAGDVGMIATNFGLAPCNVIQVDRQGISPKVLIEYNFNGRMINTWVTVDSLVSPRPEDADYLRTEAVANPDPEHDPAESIMGAMGN